MHPSLVIILSSTVYCVVNATIMALLLNYQSGIKRFKMFFEHTFVPTAFSLFMILVGQIIIDVHYDRAVLIAERCFFSAAAERCPGIPIEQFLMHDSVMILVLVGLIAMTIQFFCLEEAHDDAPERLLAKLLLSNTLACAAKYLVIIMLLNY